MIARTFSSMTAGLLVTTGLLFLMQILIATGEDIITEPRIRYVVDWVRVPEPEQTAIIEPAPVKPDRPPTPPKTRATETSENDGFGGGVLVEPPVPTRSRPEISDIPFGDGPLINVIKVQPQYPPAAERRGLSGVVIVRFDVTEIGTVENAVVVESSNSVFNKAAIDAASRFKFKPRVVDGKTYGAKGLRQQFRFDMDD